MKYVETSRILFVNYSGEWTGPTKSLLLLLQVLKEDFDVSVLFPGGGSLERKLEEQEIAYFTSQLTKWTIPSMRELIRRERFDVVYANNTHGSSRNAFLAALGARTPFVCHVRGMAWDKSWLRLGYLRFADAVVAVSKRCGESVRRFVRRGRLHVVYNGVPLKPEPARRTNGSGIRDELGLPADSVILLSLSHVCRRKGQEYAVEALAGIREAGRPVHLCVAGRLDREPDYTSRVRQRASELGVEDKVHLLGFRRNVRDLLTDADIVVHSALEDPHPRAVVEAMAASVPVVAFGVDGVAETVLDGSTGRLVEPGDATSMGTAIVELVQDVDGCRRMGEAARRRVEENFSCASTARGVRRVLETVIQDNGGVSG